MRSLSLCTRHMLLHSCATDADTATHTAADCPCCCSYRRNKSYTPKYNASAAPTQKSKSYWDSVDWDAPLVSFVPDKWYVRVAWLVLIVGVTVCINWQYGGGSSSSSLGGGS
jgi:hypothetical protein